MPTVDPTKYVEPDLAWITELEKKATLPAAEKELEDMGLLDNKATPAAKKLSTAKKASTRAAKSKQTAKKAAKKK